MPLSELTPEQRKENARKGGLASVDVRRARKAQNPRERVEALLANHAPALVYGDLGSKERASLVVKALEFGIGRPPPSARLTNHKDEPEPFAGLLIEGESHDGGTEPVAGPTGQGNNQDVPNPEGGVQ